MQAKILTKLHRPEDQKDSSGAMAELDFLDVESLRIPLERESLVLGSILHVAGFHAKLSKK